MQDFGIPLVNGIVPIVTLLSLSMLLSYGSPVSAKQVASVVRYVAGLQHHDRQPD